jgi:hypothetical protein
MWSQQEDHWLHQLINKFWWNVIYGNQYQIYSYVKEITLSFFFHFDFMFFFTSVPWIILVQVTYACVHSCNKFSSFLFREKKIGWFSNFKFILICVHLFLNILLFHFTIFLCWMLQSLHFFITFSTYTCQCYENHIIIYQFHFIFHLCFICPIYVKVLIMGYL